MRNGGEAIMEPISVLSAVGPIVKAAEAIAKLLSNRDQLAKDDVQYYATYIAVAGEAIKGLEAEYLGILRQAAQCNVKKPTERKELRDRIKDYVNGEVLRPALRDAIDRLRVGREAIQEHAGKLLIWPKAKEKRTAAVAKFDALLDELEGYLGSLGDYFGPSAVALDEIMKIDAELSAGRVDRDKFDNMIGDLLMNLNKSKLISITGQCGRVIETLRIAFR